MIEIDLNLIFNFVDQILADFQGQSTLGIIYLLLFKYWLWVLFVYIFVRYLAFPEYMLGRQGKWVSKQPVPVLLAIDVPKRNEQSIQAVENMLDHFQGAHGTFTKWGKYIDGEFQRSLSLELVSIEGNVQFLIRCPGNWRNLIEAAVYGQFPDAEITEVEDYVNSVPKEFPNDTHDIWGCEFTLSSKNPYLPIKPFYKFEHAFAKTFVDPMAALLETMSSIGEGSQIWIQIILIPLAVDWGKDAAKEVAKMIGKPAPAAKTGMIGSLMKAPTSLASEFTEQLAGISLTGAAEEKKEAGQPSLIPFLSPREREQVEAMERKANKWAFKTKIRYLYIYEKDKSNKVVGVNGVIGSIKQWNDVSLNGLKPDLGATGTSSPQYVFIKYRQKIRKNRLMSAYRGRSTVVGTPAKPMSTEELASLWHFPSMFLKAPLVKKTDFTKVAAPVGLPLGEQGVLKPVKKESEVSAEQEAEISEEEVSVEPSFDYDSDDFERQFAKDKEAFAKSRPQREQRLKEIEAEEKKKIEELKELEEEGAQVLQAQAQEEANADADEKAPSNLPFID